MTESAVPAHLRVPRTNAPQRGPAAGDPPSPGFSHRLAEDVTTLVTAYIGIQSETAGWETLAGAIAGIDRRLEHSNVRHHRDRARYQDGAGYKTILIAAYWLDRSEFDRWFRDAGKGWVSPASTADGFGRFLEVLWPGVERVETIVSSTDGQEGFGAVAETVSGPVREHLYWGSMRDRLPITQVDAIAAGDAGPAKEVGDRLTVVHLDANACVIRSGQDYSDTTGEERSFYLDTVEPTLRVGMDFLRDEGVGIGCYLNRYLEVLDDQFRVTEKTYGLSWWVDMESLEVWAESHPTHRAIFGSFMQHVTRFGESTQLRLYHEVMVPDAGEQRFWYLDCHPRTGVLQAGSARQRPGHRP